MATCVVCNEEIKSSAKRYCSNKCQREHEYQKYVNEWKEGIKSGRRGINAQNISGHVIRYLKAKYSACAICGWNEPHPTTGKVPLEIDHIDGNSENNKEENLRLICPNCHSLTSNFRNLNKGHGRGWRRDKYVKVVQ